MKKGGLILIIFVTIFIIVTLLLSKKKTPTTELKTITINNHVLKVELADTDEKRSKGLSGRKNLGQNEGMLFIFSKADFYKFWMKGMNFPLDFIWIKGDEVVDITENVPIPASEPNLPTYTSKLPADKVLEVNRGTVKALKITIGDKVSE